MVNTPFNELQECKIIRKINTNELIQKYLVGYDVDVSSYFSGIEVITLYECPKSKIRFFLPNDVMGDSAFYEKFQQFDWYYMDWKWEQQKALELINPVDKILEIGSGKGNFIRKLTELNYDVLGLELNKKEVEKCQAEQLNVQQKYLEELDPATIKFDTICSFQVFEHIPNLGSVIEQSIKLLKPNGKLIFSVPNMDAFIKYNDGGILNFPPHHINWFTKKTFNYISHKYNLELTSLHYEPLQTYHYPWFYNYFVERYFPTTIGHKIARSHWGEKLIKSIIHKFAYKIHSHTVLVEFSKK